MISHWDVIDMVASRFGDREAEFAQSALELEKAKKGLRPLSNLEENDTRVRYRMAREHLPPVVALERIIGSENFQDKYVLDKLSEMAQAVCRILKQGTPVGTGFLVSGNILLTNHHVLGSPEEATDMLAEFDYELDQQQLPKQPVRFRLDPNAFFLTSGLELDTSVPFSGLDFTLVGLAGTGIDGQDLNRYKPVFLDGNLGKIIKGEGCVILQHPNGLPKKITLKNIAFFSETGTRLVYESDTLPGSSGAMVVALGTCEIIALHHSGLAKTDGQNRVLTRSGELATPFTPEKDIDWLGNEGIKVSRIVEAIREATLPPQMETGRRALLQKTEVMAAHLQNRLSETAPLSSTEVMEPVLPLPKPEPTNSTPAQQEPTDQKPMEAPNQEKATGQVRFLLTAINKPEVIARIEATLTVRYGNVVKLALAMPASAVPGETELFTFETQFAGNVQEEARQLPSVPEILNAEADVPLRLNADPGLVAGDKTRLFGTESNTNREPENPEREEAAFQQTYSGNDKSPYVDGMSPEEFRRWNWQATRFDKALTPENLKLLREYPVRVVQFDTGYSGHSKVKGGFDLDLDENFIETVSEEIGARDPLTAGFNKFPGHGTRTGSLLIGVEHSTIPREGNFGFLTRSGARLVPYRISESVIILSSQKQLSDALDQALYQQFDVITMSLGLPPTVATARMAKKAYDKGAIWCCAAGNAVKAVVAPAVFPGTIAVAASNPLDRSWTGSSRGDTVDISAPGQDVYVPVWKTAMPENVTTEAFGYGDGTSYATPHVAAAAVYWLAKYRNELSTPAFAGWRRVEAFRKALKDSARKAPGLSAGFGAGILDVETLLKTPPKVPAEADYAYNNWNENAFLASLQGYAELLKTYWNQLHGWFSGSSESLGTGTTALSQRSRELEQALFPVAGELTESQPAPTYGDLMQRYQAVQAIVESSAK